MEAASCSILHSTFLNCKTSYNITANQSCHFNFTSRHAAPPLSGFCKKSLKAFCTPFSRDESSPSHQLALLLEVEGVLMDVYRLCNRESFNIAFRKLGLDCANWTEPIYLDLVRRSAGDEEKMLMIYFNRISWPTSVPTNEKGAFVKNVLREKKNAVDDLVMSKPLPLRPGVEEFIDDAFEDEVPVVILTSYSKIGEKAARSIVQKLGNERMSKVKVLGDTEVKESLYWQLVSGKGVSSSLDEQLAKEVAKAALAKKQKIAEEVATILKLSIDMDTTTSESLQYVVATLRAGAELADLPVNSCLLIAGSQSGVIAAERISMPSVVLRSSSTARAEFPSAKATMDGFGGADLTISRLLRMMKRS